MKLPFYIILVVALWGVSAAHAGVMEDLSSQMKFLGQRQSVISENLANANTPGFKAKDVMRPQSEQGGLKLATTSPMHFSSLGQTPGGVVVEDRNVRSETLDGNTVEIEDQMIKMNETSMEYKEALGLMRKMNGLMRTAIGSSSR